MQYKNNLNKWRKLSKKLMAHSIVQIFNLLQNDFLKTTTTKENASFQKLVCITFIECKLKYFMNSIRVKIVILCNLHKMDFYLNWETPHVQSEKYQESQRHQTRKIHREICLLNPVMKEQIFNPCCCLHLCRWWQWWWHSTSS